MRSRLRSESHRCYRYTIPDESDVVSDVVGGRMGSLRYVSRVLSQWSVEWWISKGCALVVILKRGATSGSPCARVQKTLQLTPATTIIRQGGRAVQGATLRTSSLIQLDEFRGLERGASSNLALVMFPFATLPGGIRTLSLFRVSVPALLLPAGTADFGTRLGR